jgi:hypothetical protein
MVVLTSHQSELSATYYGVGIEVREIEFFLKLLLQLVLIKLSLFVRRHLES